VAGCQQALRTGYDSAPEVRVGAWATVTA